MKRLSPVSDIPEAVFAELQNLANGSEMPVEDYAKGVICDAVAEHWHSGEDDITFSQLQANLEAIFRVVEREQVFLVDEDGQRYVFVSCASSRWSNSVCRFCKLCWTKPQIMPAVRSRLSGYPNPRRHEIPTIFNVEGLGTRKLTTSAGTTSD